MNLYKFIFSLISTTPMISKLTEQLACIAFTFYFMMMVGCKAIDDVPFVAPKGTLIDVEGNIYNTIKIGNQWWMTENLKVTKFRDGQQIPHALTDSDWQKPEPAYCIYNNNAEAPGLLYNFYCVTDAKKIAPYGWHIPSDEEWKELEMFLGMSASDVVKVNWRGTNEGDMLKIEAPKGWNVYKNIWGTNESGFKALAGSCRLFNGIYGDPGLTSTGFWWSSTPNDNGGWYRYLDYKNSNIFRYYGPKNYGFSIRCVKN